MRRERETVKVDHGEAILKKQERERKRENSKSLSVSRASALPILDRVVNLRKGAGRNSSELLLLLEKKGIISI